VNVAQQVDAAVHVAAAGVELNAGFERTAAELERQVAALHQPAPVLVEKAVAPLEGSGRAGETRGCEACSAHTARGRVPGVEALRPRPVREELEAAGREIGSEAHGVRRAPLVEPEQRGAGRSSADHASYARRMKAPRVAFCCAEQQTHLASDVVTEGGRV